MLKDIKRGELVKEISYGLQFMVDQYGGYEFPCDSNGNLLPDTPEAAMKNYEICMKHPEKYIVFNDVIKHTHTYREPTTGLCSCGERVELWDQYLGACECPKCGRWYNLFGQELLHPDQWEEEW